MKFQYSNSLKSYIVIYMGREMEQPVNSKEATAILVLKAERSLQALDKLGREAEVSG